MKYLKFVYIFIFSFIFFLTSCENTTLENTTLENLDNEVIPNSDNLLESDVIQLIQATDIKYPITIISNNITNKIINSNNELSNYIEINKNYKIKYPIDITIDGVTKTIENIKQLRNALSLKKETISPPSPLAHDYPFSVYKTKKRKIEDKITIENLDEMEAYLKTLGKGIKPIFHFPISLENGSITIIGDVELNNYIKSIRKSKQ